MTISDLEAIFNVSPCRNGAVHLLPPRCYCRQPKGEARHGRNRQAKDRPNGRSRRINRPVPGGRSRSPGRSDRGSAQAAVEAAPRFGNFDAEFEPAGASVVDVGVNFGRKLRARGDAAKGRPADKAFRDSLFDDS
jgi:hypothetical protein